MSDRVGRGVRLWAALVCLALAMTACATTIDGKPSVGNAPNAHLDVQGTDGGAFDATAQNALADIEAFWRTEYPKVSGGKALQPLKGGLYSVDGLKVAETKQLTGPAANNACARKSIDFVIDNGAFCTLDDSISWDRAPTHLFARLAQKYGPLVVALIFAHEFGHAISYRLGVFDEGLPTIDTESQADCAAGAWAASALKGQDPHFRDITAAKIDAALEGYLDGRDSTPGTDQDISHGNGFDRLSALADGVEKGAGYCFSAGYFASRTFTIRPFYADELPQDNTPLSEILTPTKNAFVADLNRYWTGQAKATGKTFTPVTIAEAPHPKCGSPASSEFGYCPADNTVYYSSAFAKSAYYSLPDAVPTGSVGNIELLSNQPGDFALGVLFAVGWGMAVRHQLFARALTGQDALEAAVCYSGAYAKDINVPPGTPNRDITLSPGDLDEATSSMLDQVGSADAFGARGTTGLSRIQKFIEGYSGGLSTC